jgi:hypothetical protein
MPIKIRWRHRSMPRKVVATIGDVVVLTFGAIAVGALAAACPNEQFPCTEDSTCPSHVPVCVKQDTSDDTGMCATVSPPSDGGVDDGGQGSEIVLQNATIPCRTANVGTLAPLLPDEANVLAVTKLTPPAWPFFVTELSYYVGSLSYAPCNGALAHEVLVMVHDGDLPPSSPSTDGTLIERIPVSDEGVQNGPAQRLTSIPFVTPIELTDGESLFVGITIATNDDVDQSICVYTCTESATPGVNFWSEQATEPYSFLDVVTALDVPGDFQVWVRGAL